MLFLCFHIQHLLLRVFWFTYTYLMVSPTHYFIRLAVLTSWLKIWEKLHCKVCFKQLQEFLFFPFLTRDLSVVAFVFSTDQLPSSFNYHSSYPICEVIPIITFSSTENLPYPIILKILVVWISSEKSKVRKGNLDTDVSVAFDQLSLEKFSSTPHPNHPSYLVEEPSSPPLSNIPETPHFLLLPSLVANLFTSRGLLDKPLLLIWFPSLSPYCQLCVYFFGWRGGSYLAPRPEMSLSAWNCRGLSQPRHSGHWEPLSQCTILLSSSSQKLKSPLSLSLFLYCKEN